MMLGRWAGLKGRAARAGKPALALDPRPPTQQRADMPFASGVSGSGCHLYFAGGGDISTLRRQGSSPFCETLHEPKIEGQRKLCGETVENMGVQAARRWYGRLARHSAAA